jgi:hypothetical protein
MQQVWQMAAQPVKILPAREATHTLPTFVILLETRYVHYIEWGNFFNIITAKSKVAGLAVFFPWKVYR